MHQDDAKAYAAWLSRKTGMSYRLLTEAEWGYAARWLQHSAPLERRPA
ncbi:MAG: SUMF1/EgtB/PvdO family nonheme iron enzyme [Betaproteobacteria bacterium]|nr:SUMF1/EgtB/PvdO family nonheme iron enzyme [Betaproteobacteria bacterium]